MHLIKLINKTLIVLIMIISLFFLSGMAYSFFTAGLTGTEADQTITAEAGDMKVIYEGGASITAENIQPSTEPFATKNFILKGTSTMEDSQMGYKLYLIIDENTFSESAISYTLESVNTSGNGDVVQSIDERQGLNDKDVYLGRAKYTGKITDSIHTYTLKLYFYETWKNQSADMRKKFSAHINAESWMDFCSVDRCLDDLILAQGDGKEAIESKGSPDFSVIATSTDSGLYAVEDEYGTSYYYRGTRDLLNNNIIFAGYLWKIIRINGDGSIRIIYHSTEGQYNASIGSGSSSLPEYLKRDSWNKSYSNDAKYVGYMYGGANGANSTQRDGLVSSAATYNETSSNAKTILDTWYEATFLGKSFEKYIVDNIFCNDRRLQSGIGYGETGTYYAARERLYTKKTPTLKCGQLNDRFTINRANGNGALMYPIGLITADEASFAGLVYNRNNSTNYLTGSLMSIWTLSPLQCASSSDSAAMFNINSSGALTVTYYTVQVSTSTNGFRPVLNIEPEIAVTGDGSFTNPFRLID